MGPAGSIGEVVDVEIDYQCYMLYVSITIRLEFV